MSWTKEQMYKLTAELEFTQDLYVNLGIGMPTNVGDYIPNNRNITLHSENGMLGMGPYPYPGGEDPDLINAGKETITSLPESSYFDSATSFDMIRGSHLDLAILGALQVDQGGNLANWTVPGKIVKGMGGAMDIVANIKRIVIIMEHNTKDGAPKLLKKCTLPLTGINVVNRIITDLGVFDINKDGLSLIKKADNVTLDEIVYRTEAKFTTELNI